MRPGRVFPAPENPGLPVEPYRPPAETESPDGLPLTTLEKAALCDALLPFLTGLREALWAVMAKNPEAHAGPEAIFMARLLLADVRRLLRGERMAHYLGGLSIEDDSGHRFGLALKLATMETAARQFRLRYFGWHPLLGRPGWHLGGDSAVEDARRLLPRDGTAPAPTVSVASTDMARLRKKLAQHIARLAAAQAQGGAPQPLHAGGTSRKGTLKSWPEVG